MIDLMGALGEEHFRAMMHGIARGRYQVLLGAGASVSSRDRRGESLPTGRELRDDVVDAFELPPADSMSLKRVYQLAKTRSGPGGATIDEYLAERFTETQPAEWYDVLLKMEWAGLWTLNIDDCVERAAVRLGSDARQKAISISWTDRHRVIDRRRDNLNIVHLHGKASRASRAGELVFDIASYVNALTAQHRWMKIFGDEFPASPFLVVGASLDEEIDLQSVFEEGRADKSALHPSVIVLRDIDDFQEQEYRGYGLIPVRSTAEDFFNAVRQALPDFLDELAPDEVEAASGASPETLKFLEDWRRLSLTDKPRIDRAHDLYLGHEPRWSDAVMGLISRRSANSAALSHVTRRLKYGEHAVVLITGEAFSGKSSMLFDLSVELIGRGFTPYCLDQSGAIDVESILYWTGRVPKSVLLIDNSSDFAQDIAALLDDPRTKERTLRIAMVERSSRTPHIKAQLISHHSANVSIPAKLSDAESSRLLALLSKRKRLGILTPMSQRERTAFVDERGRKLFSVMAALEDGRGFQSRVRDEFDKVTSREHRRLLAVVGLTSRMGYFLPLEIVKTSAGLTAHDAEGAVLGELSDLLAVERGRLSARHRVFGEILVNYLTKDERLEAMEGLGRALAPHVSPDSISAATLYYRIARTLMGRAMVLELLGGDRGMALEFYSRLESAFDWNARFWEQRALTAALDLRFEPAYSWALQSVARKRDAFTLNTTGVVLMQRAFHEALSGEWPTDTYEKAVGYLDEARKLEGPKAEYPIETFFTYTTRIIERVSDRDRGLNTQLRHLWSSWYNAILTLDPTSQLRLEDVRRQAGIAWDKYGFADF